MSDMLCTICLQTQKDINARMQKVPMSKMQAQAAQYASRPRGFLQALRDTSDLALIAEIKKASPSAGMIRADFDPAALAKAYENAGATCLSILTDQPFFHGHEDYLKAARAACALPALRKDFILDPYQVYEARAIGADAILLIVAALEDSRLAELESIALDLGMDVLIEVHDKKELERALALRSPLIGINNRNLKTMITSLDTFRELSSGIPDNKLLVAESGLKTHADLLDLRAHGAKAFLIGESLMKQKDVETATKEILGKI